ncbi:hypothetical protein AAFF_G00031780 [Aldrovandia affinis]|uniref:Uncharacterized protein n=1 Tax=Aldrovandia affinis TaxID=143900 RepID=A0AAD7WGT6_9TELE|nr:hypothetical protein AAFF_G00031780 [Aldrovandia affinis]
MESQSALTLRCGSRLKAGADSGFLTEPLEPTEVSSTPHTCECEKRGESEPVKGADLSDDTHPPARIPCCPLIGRRGGAPGGRPDLSCESPREV